MGKRCREYRADARAFMKGKYWNLFGVSLLVTLIAGITGGVVTLIQGVPNFSNVEIMVETVDSTRQSLGSLVSLLLAVFVAFPLSVGLTRYFLVSTKENAELGELGFAFKNSYMTIIGTLIKETIFVALWSMLFVIPGIIKSYSYFMVEYIMAENPSIGSKRAFEISKQAMKGYKGKAFLLGLSFIGWFLLCSLTFGIGTLFLAPYIQAANTVFYLDVKNSAFERGIIAEGELPRN